MSQTTENSAATRESKVLALVHEIDRYLAGMTGPGIADVRAGIAGSREHTVKLSAAPGPNTVVSQYLPVALTSLHETHPSFAAAISAAQDLLVWETYNGYDSDKIGAAFATGHAYTSIIGQGAPLSAGDYDLGLFLIGPNILYRDHFHLAPELYAPLTGPHGWRFRPEGDLTIKAAHEPVWNEPNAIHLTKVGEIPFLSVFAWTRDVNQRAHLSPAFDWAALETCSLAELCKRD